MLCKRNLIIGLILLSAIALSGLAFYFLKNKAAKVSAPTYQGYGVDFEAPDCLGNQGYKKCQPGVYYKMKKISQADVESFVDLGYEFAKDKNHVYYKGQMLEQADSQTFHAASEGSGNFIDKSYGYGNLGEFYIPLDEFWFVFYDKGGENLGGNYRKYKDWIFYWDNGPQAAASMVKLNLDASQFTTQSKYFIWDQNVVYPNDFNPVKSAEAKTFEDLGNGYGKDARNVFYQEHIVAGADLATFQSFSTSYWENKPKDYYINKEGIFFYQKQLEYLMSKYGKDKQHVYSRDCMIEGADPVTFLPLEFGYSQDAKNVYYNCEKVSGADPKSFKVLDQGAQITGADFIRDPYAKDKQHVFSGKDMVTYIDADLVEVLRNEKNLAHPEKEWKLISGDPKDNCTHVIYEGEAKLHGWYVWERNYSQEEWMLHVSDLEIPKFPDFNKDDIGTYGNGFRLEGASKELEAKLKKADKNHPVTLTIKGFYAYCEGAPIVSIQDPQEAFPDRVGSSMEDKKVRL